MNSEEIEHVLRRRHVRDFDSVFAADELLDDRAYSW